MLISLQKIITILRENKADIKLKNIKKETPHDYMKRIERQARKKLFNIHDEQKIKEILKKAIKKQYVTHTHQFHLFCC